MISQILEKILEYGVDQVILTYLAQLFLKKILRFCISHGVVIRVIVVETLGYFAVPLLFQKIYKEGNPYNNRQVTVTVFFSWQFLEKARGIAIALVFCCCGHLHLSAKTL